MISNTVTMILNKDEVYRTKALTQGDYGQRLIFKGYDLPGIYEVHFSNEPEGESKKCTGDSSGVDIPDEFLVSGKPIYVWVFMHHALEDGKTVFRGYIPVTKKALPTDESITPVEQSQFEQMIAALERETNRIPVQINTALQQAKDSGEFDGPKGDPGDDGYSPEIDITIIPGGHRVVVRDAYHVYGFDIMDGTDGNDGNGITSAVLNPDYTLTLTFTDGTSYTTPNIRGEKGDPGLNGAVFVPSVDENGVLRWTNNGGLPNPEPVPLIPDLSDYAKKTELTEKIDASEKGTAGGVAELDGTGKVPVSQLPTFVSDYEDLTHKPSIGGVTLSGNKTLHDLGAAAEGDIPTRVSELQNDSGYITGYTETDPTVPSWAKQSNKPTYTASEVGLGNVANERQYSANNPPPSDNTKQDKINVSGILKGNGSGGVSAAVAGTDYLTGEIIDDTAGTGDTEHVWSANKSATEKSSLQESINAKYTKPANGIPASDIASGVIPDVSGFYTKPASGIPASDLAAGVVPDVQTKADKVSGATNNNFAALDANGNLKDSGHKHSDYTTAEIVSVSATQPSDSGNKLWIKDQAEQEYTVPTYAEHQALLNAINDKYEKPSTGIPKTDLASGVQNSLDAADSAYQKPQSGIPASDLASGVIPDVPETSATYGTNTTYDNKIATARAESSSIKAGSDQYKPITPYGQHESVFYGLAKAAGVDEKDSTYSVGIYTIAARSAINTMFNLPVTMTGTTVSIPGKAGIQYLCGEVATLSITPPVMGSTEVIFTSGSTPTVLTVPNTVKWPVWFNPTSLAANTTYDIIIINGTLGMVMAWA